VHLFGVLLKHFLCYCRSLNNLCFLWCVWCQRTDLEYSFWLTDWLTGCWLADWLTGWLTGWLTDWLADWLTDWLTGWRTGWLADGLADWLADLLTDWLTVWLTGRLTDWRILSAGLLRLTETWGRLAQIWCLYIHGRKGFHNEDRKQNILTKCLQIFLPDCTAVHPRTQLYS